MEDSRRIEMVIGENIRNLRQKDDMSQAELGEKLGAILGTPWSRSTVSQAEAGKRSFVAAELVALAVVFGHGIHHLFRHRTGESVQLSETYTLSGRRLEALTMAVNDPMLVKGFALVREILTEQEQLQGVLEDAAVESKRLTRKAMDNITFMHPTERKDGKDA